jgi:serine/threonine-protein kinase PRP4
MQHIVSSASLFPRALTLSPSPQICDMGSGCFENDGDRSPTPYLVSRFYRSPEVMMGLMYDRGVDLWSIGVTIFELCAGRVMFAGNDNCDMLRKIQEMLGPFPPKMIKRHMLAFPALGLEDKIHFNGDLEFFQKGVDKVTGYETTTPVRILKATNPIKPILLKATQKADRRHVADLVNFIEMMLTLDEKRRPSVEAVMRDAEFVKIK